MRTMVLRAVMVLCGVCFSLWQAAPVWAHGFAGQRFFPEPLVMEDPFAADEMDLAAIHYLRGKDERELSIGVELQKRLTPTIGVAVGAEYALINPLDPTEPNMSGFTNPEFALKWVPHISAEHESVVGLQVAVAPNIGNHNVSEEHSTIHVQAAFGRGLGDLPASLSALRPLAIEGAAGLETPLGATDPEGTLLTYNVALQYSLLYLQSFVKDVGLPWPLNRLFPTVEFSGEMPVSGAGKGRTMAYAYPGLVFTGKKVELGIEAQIPLNDDSGDNVGVLGLIHLFLDDMAPSVFHPLFE
ncbi:MAG: hypothetical protein HY208_06490 [Nitrospirae bacterium]|nr:hypothetical protein [Nitrospirota bacterium]